MMEPQNGMLSNLAGAEGSNASNRSQITPEVIKKVTDKVYAMLLADLRLEAERQRRRGDPIHRSRGGG